MIDYEMLAILVGVLLIVILWILRSDIQYNANRIESLEKRYVFLAKGLRLTARHVETAFKEIDELREKINGEPPDERKDE